MADKIHKLDKKILLKGDTKKDLTSGVSSVYIRAEDPDGVKYSWTGSVVDTTKVQYETSLSDVNKAGQWIFQTFVVFTSGAELYGNRHKTIVDDSIQPS